MHALSALRWGLLALFLLVAACNRGSSGNSGGSSERAFVNDFADACLATANWGRDGCECAGRLAVEEFEGDARTFVLAMIQQDQATTDRLRPSLSFEEVTEAGLFMVHAGTECADASL